MTRPGCSCATSTSCARLWITRGRSSRTALAAPPAGLPSRRRPARVDRLNGRIAETTAGREQGATALAGIPRAGVRTLASTFLWRDDLRGGWSSGLPPPARIGSRFPGAWTGSRLPGPRTGSRLRSGPRAVTRSMAGACVQVGASWGSVRGAQHTTPRTGSTGAISLLTRCNIEEMGQPRCAINPPKEWWALVDSNH